jgi:hypothetical protein
MKTNKTRIVTSHTSERAGGVLNSISLPAFFDKNVKYHLEEV